MISGKDVWVDDNTGTGFGCIQSYSINTSVSAAPYTSSCNAGGTGRGTGITTQSGTITGIGSEPDLFPDGTLRTARFIISDSPAKSLTGSIQIDSLSINIDRESGGPISWTASFGVDGLLTSASTSEQPSGVESIDYSKDLILELGEVGAPTTISPVGPVVRSLQLNFSRNNPTYQDGAVMKRTSNGGILDFNFSVSVYDSTLAWYDTIKNNKYIMDAYVNSTDFWHIEWARFLSADGWTLSNSTPNVPGYTVSGGWDNVDDSTLGTIIGPSETIYYGS